MVGTREQPGDQGRHELHPEPTLDITEDPEEIAERVHYRIQAEIQHEDKEVEVAEEVMLEIPLEWNAVPDLIMEDKEELIIMETDNKQMRDEEVQGRKKQRKEDDIRLEKREHSPWYLGKHETQKDFIPKTGMSLIKKKMNGRRQTNGRGFCRWCFVADV